MTATCARARCRSRAAGGRGAVLFDGGRIAEDSRADADPRVNVVMQDGRRFVSLSGVASVVDDRALIEELWSESWKVWFPKGKDDPSLRIAGRRACRGGVLGHVGHGAASSTSSRWRRPTSPASARRRRRPASHGALQAVAAGSRRGLPGQARPRSGPQLPVGMPASTQAAMIAMSASVGRSSSAYGGIGCMVSCMRATISSPYVVSPVNRAGERTILRGQERRGVHLAGVTVGAIGDQHLAHVTREPFPYRGAEAERVGRRVAGMCPAFRHRTQRRAARSQAN